MRLLPLGAYSLDTRIQLAQRATDSLDVQYYQLENDSTGRLLLATLRDASQRGVRVRLLVDDLYTTHSDPLLRGLASFPNVEVRLFNPFCCGRGGGVAGRYAASIFDFGRLNHRMHNKLFIADGVMAVAGGRNIADEYFLRAQDANFVDMDAFVMGAVVQLDVGDLRPLLEQRGRLPDRGGRRAARRQAGAREGVRRDDRRRAAVAADRAAGDRRARLRPARRGARRRPARPAVGHRARLRRPAREAARDDAQDRLRDERHQRRDDAGLAGQERSRPHLALHDPGRERHEVVPTT